MLRSAGVPPVEVEHSADCVAIGCYRYAGLHLEQLELGELHTAGARRLHDQLRRAAAWLGRHPDDQTIVAICAVLRATREQVSRQLLDQVYELEVQVERHHLQYLELDGLEGAIAPAELIRRRLELQHDRSAVEAMWLLWRAAFLASGRRI